MDFILLRVNDEGTPPPMIFSVRTWRVTNETAPYFLLAGSCYVQYGNCGSVGVACRWRCFETQRYLWVAKRHEDL